MVKKIMVVDDNPDVTFSVKQGLEDLSEEYSIICAESGKECLELLQKKQMIPDLILLDLMMPEMSGWELFDQLKEHSSWKNIPIVFLTARKDRVAKSAGIYLGNDYIEKPFEITEVKERIDKILQKK